MGLSGVVPPLGKVAAGHLGLPRLKTTVPMTDSTAFAPAIRAHALWRVAAAWLLAGLLGVPVAAGAADARIPTTADGVFAAPLAQPSVPAPAASASGPDGAVGSLVRQVPAGLQGAWKSLAQGVADVPAEWSVIEQGTASFLWNGLNGRRTASGERYNMNELTAAHKTLPFGTQVIVRSLETGREVMVRIIDRGPHLKDRVIDLSRAAAKALGIQSLGVSEVQVIAVPPAP